MRELLTARTVSSDFTASRQLIVATPGGAQIESPRDPDPRVTDRAFGRVLRHHVSRLRALQRWLGLLAGITVGTAGLTSRLSPFYGDVIPIPPQLGAAVGLVGLCLFIVTIILQFSIATLKAAIEDMQEALSDRSLFFDLLRELGVDPGSAITIEGFEASVHGWLDPYYWRRHRRRRWSQPIADFEELAHVFADHFRMWTPLQNLARRIGRRDFARLMLAKGVEIRLLARTERVADGRLVTEYRVVLPSSVSDNLPT